MLLRLGPWCPNLAQLAKLRAERDRIDEEAARARIKAATEASLAAAPRDKKKADAAGAPFKLVKVVKKKPTPAKRTTEETERLRPFPPSIPTKAKGPL